MNDKKKIATHYDCPICGDTVEVLTAAEQTCPCNADGKGNCSTHEGYWWAVNGDEAVCPGCGAQGQVICEGGEASVSIDDTTPHNAECWRKYDASIPDKDHPNNPDNEDPDPRRVERQQEFEDGVRRLE